MYELCILYYHNPTIHGTEKQCGGNWALTEIWNYFLHGCCYFGHKTALSFVSNSNIAGPYEIYMSTCEAKAV